MPIFSVYVVELKESVCHRTVCASRLSGKPHVDVGETEQTPDERFKAHLAGGFTSARAVQARHRTQASALSEVGAIRDTRGIRRGGGAAG